MRVYRTLLRLLPAEFRERWRGDMEELFLLRRNQAGSVPWRVAWFWCRAVADVAMQAFVQRVWVRTTDRGGEVGPRTFFWDVRRAARSLRTSPGLALAALSTLALGIGAATATWSVLYAVVLRELPYPQPDRLVLLWPEVNGNKSMVGLAEDEIDGLAAVGGISRWTLTMTGVGDPVEITGTLVSPHHFEMVGVQPALGRSFLPEEGLVGRAGVTVLSNEFWVSAFGADPGVIGRSVEIAGAQYERRTVIGVMPPGYRPVIESTDVWVPLETDPAIPIEEDGSWFVNERIARLAPGASLQLVGEQLRSHARGIQERVPSVFSDEEVATASVQPLAEFITGGDTRRALWVALGAVMLVLVIACANVSNLLLARGDARARSLSLHAALGASRSRIARMLFAEACMLGLLGGALGVAVAFGLVRILVRLAPQEFPRISEVAVTSPGVLAYAIGATVGATVLAGVIPALRASRVDGTSCLCSGTRGRVARVSTRVTCLLVGTQVALAVVVAVGSGLMVRSLGELLTVDPGIDGRSVLVLKPNPLGSRYPDGEAFRSYYAEVVERVAAVRGVTSAGAIQLLPGTSNNWSFPTRPEGYEIPEGAQVPAVNFRAVRPGYFETVRQPLRQGRFPGAADGASDEPVVAVNEAFVDRFWPGAPPLGRIVRIFSAEATPYRVVGVVGDVRQHSRAAEPRPEMYLSHDQVPWDQMSMWILARISSGEPLDHADEIRAAVWSLDPDVPISGVSALDAVLDHSTQSTRFVTLLLSVFGTTALLLGGVGVFGVTAYTIGRRAPEFGLRLALGSSRGGVLVSAAFGSTAASVAVALAIGLLIAAASSSVIESLLYGVGSTDPIAYASVTVVVASCAALAILVPAWRAAGVDPRATLNAE